jgi:protoporphyrinogen oxidase
VTDIVVLGSGMAALGASYRLRQEKVPHVAYDMNAEAGGHTSSHADEHGFVFDEGPHISFTKDDRIKALLAENVNGDYVSFTAQVNNYWKGHWVKHPAQCNLHGLPTDLVVKVIEDMFASRAQSAAPANYEEWLVASFGRTFAETFPMQYGRKYHTAEARNMSLDWLGPRLYQPSMKEVLTGALTPSTPDVHYISDFRYPKNGGFLSFLRPMLSQMDIRLKHRLVRLDPKSRTLHFDNGAQVPYQRLISSIPLPELIKTMPDAPADVAAAAAQLACSICMVVNVGLARADVSDWHWTYFYDEDFCFSRLSFPHMFAPNNAPQGMGSIQAEVYFSDKYKPLTGSPEQWIERVITDLRRCGLIRADDRIVTKSALHVRYANVIFDLERAAALATVKGYLDELGIQCCGRYGEWGYLWTDESFISGEQAAQRALDATGHRV